mmetsp:Transcript_10423/g.25547  ORF Transcript_10423/g.25547 Transcript_10423/m.25547 type:complete len:81 (-) Transcript_10423:1465-1707(-)
MLPTISNYHSYDYNKVDGSDENAGDNVDTDATETNYDYPLDMDDNSPDAVDDVHSGTVNFLTKNLLAPRRYNTTNRLPKD